MLAHAEVVVGAPITTFAGLSASATRNAGTAGDPLEIVETDGGARMQAG